MAIYDDLTKYTFESIHSEALNSVSDDVDKREGSVVFDMTAPAAMIIAKCFDVLYQVAMQSRIQTANGEYLDLCASQNKIYRNQATPAKWRIHVEPIDEELPIGTRFISTNGLNFVYEIIAIEEDGDYIVECQTDGVEGGRDFGELEEKPIEHELERVEFVKCVDGGRDKETDAAFRLRWWSIVKSKAYGGNFEDYRTWILNDYAADGGYNFDGFFVFPAWQGGGTIKCVPTISGVNGAYLPPDPAAITALKGWIDPEPETGHGAGKAPVGHKVTVDAPITKTFNVSMTIKMDTGAALTDLLKTKIQTAIIKYFEQQRGECVTTLGDPYPFSYDLTISFSSIDYVIHAQSVDIDSVTSLMLESDSETYTSDVTMHFDSEHDIELPVTGSFEISEDSNG